MIIDIAGRDWIVRFKGKKITFRSYRTFSRLIENLGNAGETTLHFELAKVQQIAPSSMGMFLQLFFAINPEHHKIVFHNASPEIHRKLHNLLAMMDARHDLDTLVEDLREQPKKLFEKVFQARSMKIHKQNEQEEPLFVETPGPEKNVNELEEVKNRVISFMKIKPLPVH
ncbi:MAG: hypothetical protein HQM03_00650 [Magnetococcales bacterium]|nr:hypothetical protein [Magnetococcales bacterium]